MSYTPKVWVDGEIIYHQDLNRMEEGIQTAILNEEAQRVIDGCLYGGVVNPNDLPPQGNDHRYFYLAFQEGRYVHFNNHYVDSQVCLFYWSESLSNWLMLALWESSESLSVLLSGKADRVNNPTNGHLAGLDAEGNPTDSGIAASDVITTVDNALSSTSENPVQNKVIKSIIDALNAAKQDLLPDGSVFGGFVNPSSVPDTKYYYLTDLGGLYPYFDNTNVNDDALTLFYHKNNSWQNAIIAPSYQFASALYDGLEGKQDIISDLATIRSGAAAGATALQQSDIDPIENAVSIIESVIPDQASAQNQLADKNFVNSQVTTASANFVGTFETLAELQAVQNPTKNDYGFVIETDALGNQYYDRYKYNGTIWLFEYKVESTSFTSEQWAAIQSGITSAIVQKINDVIPSSASSSNKLATMADLPTIDNTIMQGSQNPVKGAALYQMEEQIYNTITASVDSLVEGKLDVPAAAGTSGQVLTSDGQGGQSWQTPQSGGVTDVTVGGTSVVSSGVAAVPAIPSVPTISTDITSDATSDTKTTSPKAVKTFVENQGYGTYSKPSGGIPASDLAAAVQTSLGKADTAVQDVSGKMDKVPTANNANLAQFVTGGNVADSGVNVFDLFVLVEDASTPPASMEPNVVYQYGTLAGNTTFPALATPTEPDIANVYCWTFATPATAPTITWPVAITSWAGGSAPTINASKSYEVSVMDGFATIIEN